MTRDKKGCWNQLGAEELARRIATVAEEKKARDVVILDIKDLTPIGDYFVICSAPTTTQVGAIAENILKKLKEEGVVPGHHEGLERCLWVLIDYGSVIVHVFREEERNFYGLERVWGDAKVLSALR